MSDSLPFIEGVRVRYVVIAWLMMIYYLPGAEYLLLEFETSLAWYSSNLVYVYYGHVFLVSLLILTVSFPNRLPIRRIFGEKAAMTDVYSGLILTAFLFVLAWPAAYIIYFPLSYLVPEFVTYWYINVPDLIVYDDGKYPFVANLLNVVSLCILAPAIEEFAFRGLILRRWAHKYGLRSAILGSSLVFGVTHSDPLGAFFFGIGMCLLYLRTQSLLVPIICHGIYNAVVWLYVLGYKIHYGPDFYYSLDDFQYDWPYGLAAFVIVVAWAATYIRRHKTDVKWKFPVT